MKITKMVMIFGILLLLIFATTAFGSARIAVDEQTNDMLSFYAWDKWNWMTSNVTCEGAFVKLINKDGGVQYWFRIEPYTPTRFLPEGILVIADKEYKVTQIETPSRMHLDSGLSVRKKILKFRSHEFFSVPADAVEAIRNSQQSVITLILPCVKHITIAKDQRVILPIKDDFLESVKKLLDVSYQDKELYIKRK